MRALKAGSHGRACVLEALKPDLAVARRDMPVADSVRLQHVSLYPVVERQAECPLSYPADNAAHIRSVWQVQRDMLARQDLEVRPDSYAMR